MKKCNIYLFDGKPSVSYSFTVSDLLHYNNYIIRKMFSMAKNMLNNVGMSISKAISTPPSTEQFEQTGQLSPDEFLKAGDKLIEVCSEWKWMPSANPKFVSKYLDEKKQFLLLEKALCKKRVTEV